MGNAINFLKILHPVTGEDLTPSPVSTWRDGSPMTDAKCGGLYNKDTEPASKTFGQYFKWNGAGFWPVSRLTSFTQEKFQKLINDFGTEPVNILLDRTVTITANLTIPKNVKVHFAPGAMLDVAAGAVVNIQSPVDNINQQLFKGSGKFSANTTYVTPEMYGAVNDGSADSTEAWQKMLDNVRPNTTILLRSEAYYVFTEVQLKTIDVSFSCNNAIVNGSIIVGDSVGKTYNCNITGGNFVTSGSAVKVLNARRVFVKDNIFSGCNKGVEVMKTPLNQQHVNAQIRLVDNTFRSVNYCFYVDRTEGNTWQTTSDCRFVGNIANSALITAIYCDGIDGLSVKYNELLFASDAINRLNKKNHIRIEGQSDWINVSGNKFFESGEESIWLSGCKSFTCNANDFAWCGQKGVYSVISLNGTSTSYNITLNGNDFDGFSGSVLSSVPTAYGTLTAMGNTVNYQNNFSNYFGATDLSTINHYILDLGSRFVQYKEKNSYNNISNLKPVKIGNYVGSAEREESFFTSSTILKKVTIPAGTATPIGTIHNGGLGNSGVYSGEVLIIAKNDTTSTANTATYKLMVSRFDTTVEVVEIFRAGLISGTAASHPSFIFSLDTSGSLIATPLGVTALDCYFFISTKGDIAINAL